MADVKVIQESDFEQSVLLAQPILVDFFAPWCGFCKKLEPILNEVATELDGKLSIVKIDATGSKALAEKYGVMGLPTMLLFKDGQMVERLVGFMPKANIINKLSSHI